MFPPTFLVILVCACAVSNATEKVGGTYQSDYESEEVMTTQMMIPLPYEYGYSGDYGDLVVIELGTVGETDRGDHELEELHNQPPGTVGETDLGDSESEEFITLVHEHYEKPQVISKLLAGWDTDMEYTRKLTVHMINDSEDVMEYNNTSTVPEAGSLRLEVSEEALLFLTGPLSTIFIPSFYTVVCLISLPINICAMVAFSLKIRPKKPAVIYMLNLACADLLFAVLLPFKIFYHFSGNNWVFGPFMCRVVTAAFYWNMYCSVLLIACISVDRLLAIVYPINSLTWRTPRNSIIACAAMWILSLAGTVPLVLSEQTYHLRQLNIITCHDVQPVHKVIWNNRIYFTILSCVLFFLPLLVTLVSYARVIWALSRIPKGAEGDTENKRRRNRAVVMSVTVLVIFVLCFTPTNCLLLVHYLQYTADLKNIEDTPVGSYAAYLIFMCLGSLNCLLDPLFYYFGSSQCQKQLASALGCHKISKSCGISQN